MPNSRFRPFSSAGRRLMYRQLFKNLDVALIASRRLMAAAQHVMHTDAKYARGRS
ncbi:MAG: hypothetical protein NTX48_17485 [Planctomycetales bacterium]|nr:hypothetical protein [Planctomycetales bacterium]